MKLPPRSWSLLGAALALSACAVADTGPPPTPEESTALAEEACLDAVEQMANNFDVAVLSSEFSQAGSNVIVGVGDTRAAWNCIGFSDGTTADVFRIGEG